MHLSLCMKRMSILDKSSDVWRRMYLQYETVLKAKASSQKDTKKNLSLSLLDEWYQQELPKAISSRNEKYITHTELAKLMTWKLKRGKFRPRLQQMVEENSPDSVEAASKKAFKALPNLKLAIEALTVLKAVGPATASAVLTAGSPQYAPFMADESMMALPGLQPLKYTLPAYLDYAHQVSTLTKSLQKQDVEFGWTPHHVELSLWTLQMAKTLKLDSTLAVLNSSSSELSANSTDISTTKKRKSLSDEGEPAKRKT